MYVRMHALIHKYIYNVRRVRYVLYVLMLVHPYIHMQVRMHVCMHVRMHACMHLSASTCKYNFMVYKHSQIRGGSRILRRGVCVCVRNSVQTTSMYYSSK